MRGGVEHNVSEGRVDVIDGAHLGSMGCTVRENQRSAYGLEDSVLERSEERGASGQLPGRRARPTKTASSLQVPDKTQDTPAPRIRTELDVLVCGTEVAKGRVEGAHRSPFNAPGQRQGLTACPVMAVPELEPEQVAWISCQPGR